MVHAWITQHRTVLVLVLLAVLAITPVAPASAFETPSFDTVLAQGSVESVSSDSQNHLIYLWTPKEVFSKQSFVISSVAFINTSQNDSVNLNLIRENGTAINMTFFEADDTSDGETYYHLAWNVTASKQETAEFMLELDINDKKVMTRDVSVPVKKPVVVSQNVSSKEQDVESINSSAFEDKVIESILEYLSVDASEFMVQQERAQDVLDISKTIMYSDVSYSDNSSVKQTSVQVSVNPIKGYEGDVRIIEVIPKSITDTASTLVFENDRPIIIEEDPVIMWHVKSVKEEETKTYAVQKETTVTGNTIILAKKDSNHSLIAILLPILLVLVVAGAILYFNKFSPNN
ncbi:MAG: hypothetical protein ACQESC_02410 [Nanobdellota archaeon]